MSKSLYQVARSAQLLLSKIRSTFLFAGGDELPGQRDGHVRVARAGVPERALRRLLPEQHVVLLQVPALPGTLPEGMRQVLVVVISPSCDHNKNSLSGISSTLLRGILLSRRIYHMSFHAI